VTITRKHRPHHLMWFVLQSLIIFAVIASNIHWHWTPNGYLPAILGAGLAWLLTRQLSVRWRERQTLDPE
jgi:hypothetical protein